VRSFSENKDGVKKRENRSFAVVIPVYNHGTTLAGIVERARRLAIPVIVVDDGSTDGGTAGLEALQGVEVLRHAMNRGKGAALRTGFERAAEVADWAITMDADGQHHPEDAPGLMAAIPDGRRPIIVGARQGMQAGEVPWTSRFGRGFSNFWIRASGGPAISDTQSGFRIYPLPESLAFRIASGRYQFELEILVKAHWSKMPIIEVPVMVTYPKGRLRVSHFRPFVDFMRNTHTFTRLITRRLLNKAAIFL